MRRSTCHGAVDDLFEQLYEELHALAHRQRVRWRGDYTLDTTALVHEAYLKLLGGSGSDVESRAHFLALAARAMRQILCNYARDQRTLKRGGSVERLALEESMGRVSPDGPAMDAADSLMALDGALERLEHIDPRRCQVVVCRFFGGLTVAETAMALRISPKTVKRDWAVAQAWLHRELMSGDARGSPDDPVRSASV